MKGWLPTAFCDRFSPADVWQRRPFFAIRTNACRLLFAEAAHFRRCLASSLTKAFILFIFRFQSRYWEIQTTTKIAVKIPA